MSPLIFALALAFQDSAPPQAIETPLAVEAPAAPVEDRLPTGAPRDDYPFVGWCYGALRGYLDLHDQVMPEVTRIESAFRRPGSRLEDDLKVYADMQKDAREKLKLFQGALTAAEQASLRPINIGGAAAVKQGHGVWRNTGDVSKARLAQEWMSWVLPARCETVAISLETRSKLIGATLSANQAPAEAPAAPEAAAPDPAATEPPTPAAPPAPG